MGAKILYIPSLHYVHISSLLLSLPVSMLSSPSMKYWIKTIITVYPLVLVFSSALYCGDICIVTDRVTLKSSVYTTENTVIQCEDWLPGRLKSHALDLNSGFSTWYDMQCRARTHALCFVSIIDLKSVLLRVWEDSYKAIPIVWGKNTAGYCYWDPESWIPGTSGTPGTCPLKVLINYITAQWYIGAFFFP